jgi:modification target Cys-rich repeat protein
MRTLPARSLWLATCAAAVLALTACPGGTKIPGRSNGVDPNTCGNYAAEDAGRKLKAFLEATVKVDTEAQRLVNVVGESCAIMGRELGMADGELKGDPKVVCDAVFARLNDDLKVSIKADAKLKVEYKPAVCTLNLEAQASATAQCEAKAEADIKMTCSGVCHGTCDGTCKASGTAGTGGSGGSGDCNGECSGTCHGSCEGSADVEASAECKAQAEVNASVDMQCTEPEFNVEVEASAIVDASKAEKAMNAMKKGFPKIFMVKARLEPFGAAVKTWAATATQLAAAGKDLASSFKDQALCITGQIKAAADAVARVNVNIEVSVEVSASASGTAGTR